MARKKPTKKDLKIIEARLLALDRQVRKDLDDRLGRVRNISEQHPTELLDMASEGELDYLSALSAQAGSATVEEIDRALQRLREGTYGTCEDCGQRISTRRLNARPFAVLCIECKRAQEGNGQDFGPQTLSARPDAEFQVNLHGDDGENHEDALSDVFRDVQDIELSELF